MLAVSSVEQMATWLAAVMAELMGVKTVHLWVVSRVVSRVVR